MGVYARSWVAEPGSRSAPAHGIGRVEEGAGRGSRGPRV